MAYDSKGRLILSHALGTRENLDLIAECIGDFRISTLGRDVGILCTSPKISQWSKNKPFHAVQNQFKVQTEEDRKRAAYGYYWFMGHTDHTNAPAAHTPIQLIERAKAMKGMWKFKPLDVYRAWDFDGYQRSAMNPYKYEDFNNSAAAQVRYPSVYHQEGNKYSDSISMSDMPHPYEEIIPMEWKDFHIVAIVCWNNNTQYLRVVDTGITVGDLDNPLTLADAEITLPAIGATASRRYDFLWAATNVDVSDSSYPEYEDHNLWVFLPESYTTWLHSAGLNLVWDTADKKGGFEVYTDSYGDINYLAMRLSVINDFTFDINFNWTLTVWQNGYQLADGMEYTGRREEGAIGLEIIVDDLIDAPVYPRTPENTMIALNLYPYRTDTGENLETYHFDPINDMIVRGAATTEDGHSVREIMNALNI